MLITRVHGPNIPAGSKVRHCTGDHVYHVDHVTAPGTAGVGGQCFIMLTDGGRIPTWHGDGWEVLAYDRIECEECNSPLDRDFVCEFCGLVAA